MKIKTIEIRSGSETVIGDIDEKLLLNIIYYTPSFEILDADNGTSLLEYNGREVPFDNTITIIVKTKNIKIKGK